MRKILFIALLVISALVSAQDGKTIYELNQKIDVQDDTITAVRGRLAALQDQVAPTLSTASTNTAGDSITLVMSESLDTSYVPPVSSMSIVTDDGDSYQPTSVAFNGVNIYLPLGDTILQGQIVRIIYNNDNVTPMRDAVGNQVGYINRELITNNSTVNSDTIAPIITFNAVYNDQRDRIYYDVNEPINITIAGWTVSADSGAVTISAVDSANKYFTASRDFEYAEGITITYSPSAGATSDTSGNELDSLSRSVSNYIQQSTSTATEDTLLITERSSDSYSDGWVIFEYNSSEADTIATDWEPGAWVQWSDVEFYQTDTVTLRAVRKSGNGGAFYLRLTDPTTGTVVANTTITSAATWDDYSNHEIPLTSTVSGTYDFYFVADQWNCLDLHYIIVETASSGSVDSIDLGGDYYFSQSGDDGNAGTEASPFKTISKLNTLIPQLQAGDSVFFNRGDTWNEAEITISGIGGTSSSEIVFTAYGTGNDPIISGGKDVSGLFTQDGNYWTYAYSGYTKSSYVKNTSGLLINGDFNYIAREPELGEYYWNTSDGSSTTITDTDRSWTTDQLVNGVVNIYTDNYTLCNSLITDNTSTGITVNTLSNVDNGATRSASTDGGNPYFLTNYREAADNDGEHWYDEDTLGVYYESALNSQTVEFPIVDRVFDIDNAEYLKFDNLDIRCANLILIDMDNSTAKFDSCKISVASTGIDVYKGSIEMTNSEIEEIHTNGILLRNTQASTINDNAFKYITYYEGLSNDYHDWNSAVAMQHTQGDLIVRYNTFDTVTIAYQTHWTEDDWWFEFNEIDEYGFTMTDVAAIYMGGDWRTDVTKSIKNNIILDSQFDRTRIVGDSTATGAGNYPHAVYFDYDSKGIVAEENTIENTNVAFFFNRNQNNIVRNNKIINAAKDLESQWATDIYMDNLIDGSSDVASHTLRGNIHVFGNNSSQVAYTFHESTSAPIDFSTFNIDNNTYHDGFTQAGTSIARKIVSYGSYTDYNLSNITNLGSFDATSTFNNLDHHLDDAPAGTTASEFILVLYNASKTTQSINIGNAHTYYDLDGNTHTGSVSIAPYESKILLYKED